MMRTKTLTSLALVLATLLPLQPIGAAAAVLTTTAQTAALAQETARTVGQSTERLVITVAGTGEFGETNGPASRSSFRTPMGMAISPQGTIYISDTKSQLIRKLVGENVSTHAGITVSADEKGFPVGTLLDGTLATSVFQHPQGMTMDEAGNIYVADSGNHVIRKITAEGVVTIAGDGIQGNADGKGSQARFYMPSDLAIAKDGTIYVTDTLNHTIRKIAPDGTVTTLNKPSERVLELAPGYVERMGDVQDGPLQTATFNEPSGIAIDSKGNLYISDTGNQRIRYIDLAKGTVTTVAGDQSLSYVENGMYVEGGYADGDAAQARFNFPRGLAVTPEGGVIIADSLNHVIRYLYQGQVTTIAGSPGQFGFVDGKSDQARFHLPVTVAVADEKTIWVVDSYNNAIRQIRLQD